MSGPWKLEQGRALLVGEALSAALNVARPDQGLESLRPYLERDPEERLFQVWIGDGTSGELPVSDAYTRDNDLIVSYAETAFRPFAAQIYWRLLQPPPEGDLRAGLDIIVSAQTSLWDAEPEIVTSSRLAAGEVWRLGRDDAEDFQRLPLAESATSYGPETGPGCFLFRPADADFSYVEMIHPTDFSCAQLSGGSGRGELAELRHVVIRRWMEKGVIVRARLRGAFVGRGDDTQSARHIYRDFCAAQIPLTV